MTKGVGRAMAGLICAAWNWAIRLTSSTDVNILRPERLTAHRTGNRRAALFERVVDSDRRGGQRYGLPSNFYLKAIVSGCEYFCRRRVGG